MPSSRQLPTLRGFVDMVQIALDAFHGPLDLLLYLVKRNEVDVLDIPIAPIAEQFLDYLQLIQQSLDVELAGDFLVMAATLMEIKSKMLLPHREEAPAADEPDPRRELVKQLMEYRKFKDAAAALEDRAEDQQARMPRELPEENDAPVGTIPVRRVELWDLVSAFGRLMRETLALQTRSIVVDDTPMHVYQAQIRERLRDEGQLTLVDLFTPPYYRARLIGVFLAILELIKGRELWLDQPEPFGEIWITLRDEPLAA
jgi:segregation and condensation protein A